MQDNPFSSIKNTKIPNKERGMVVNALSSSRLSSFLQPSASQDQEVRFKEIKEKTSIELFPHGNEQARFEDSILFSSTEDEFLLCSPSDIFQNKPAFTTCRQERKTGKSFLRPKRTGHFDDTPPSNIEQHETIRREFCDSFGVGESENEMSNEYADAAVEAYISTPDSRKAGILTKGKLTPQKSIATSSLERCQIIGFETPSEDQLTNMQNTVRLKNQPPFLTQLSKLSKLVALTQRHGVKDSISSIMSPSLPFSFISSTDEGTREDHLEELSTNRTKVELVT